MALILSSLEKAEVCGAERRSEAEETIYNRGDPDRPLYFLVKGVVKLYKSKGDTRRLPSPVLASVSGNGLFDPNLRGGDGPAVARDLPPVGHNAFLRSATRAATPATLDIP